MSATPVTSYHKQKVVKDVLPDATSCILEGLSELTQYEVKVMCMTDETFHQVPDGHRLVNERGIPKTYEGSPAAVF